MCIHLTQVHFTHCLPGKLVGMWIGLKEDFMVDRDSSLYLHLMTFSVIGIAIVHMPYACIFERL